MSATAFSRLCALKMAGIPGLENLEHSSFHGMARGVQDTQAAPLQVTRPLAHHFFTLLNSRPVLLPAEGGCSPASTRPDMVLPIRP